MLEGKVRKALTFRVPSGKITVCHPFQKHSSTNIFLPIALSISRTESPYAESRWLELWNFYGLLCEAWVGLKPEIIALGQPKIANFKKKIVLQKCKISFKLHKVQIFWEGHNNLVQLKNFIWHYLVASNYKWKMGKFFLAFSEYLNFNNEQNEVVRY